MSAHAFDAYVVSALFRKDRSAVFALGDGRLVFEDGATVEAHPDAGLLCAALHPAGSGVVTGGDDGRLVLTAEGEARELDRVRGRWIDAVAASAASGLIAYASGKTVVVLDPEDPAFRREFVHERSVADLAFDPKGRRLACATYNGAALWFARIADQKPQLLKWAGSHTGVVFSPDGRFLISAMQENALHGWRLADAKDMRMGGYPAKIKAMAFLAKGAVLATGGAKGAVVWPFAGANGPMGKQAVEVAHDEAGLVVRVAAAPDLDRLAVGRDDGRVRLLELKTSRSVDVRAEKGAAVSALAVSPDGARVAWGDEDGAAGVAAVQ